MKSSHFCILLALVVLHSLISIQVFSQTQPLPKQWDKRFGGNNEDELKSVLQTADGGYLLGGHSFSKISGDKTVINNGGNDFWVIKTDSNGEKIWDKVYGGNFYDYLSAMQQTFDGGYILGGFTLSNVSGDVSEPGRGNYDYWIIKISADGNKEWDKRFGGSDIDFLYDIKQTTDGGFILGGYSYSNPGGDVSEANRGIYDYWIIKTDSLGVKQWDKRFGGNFYDNLTSIDQTADGGYIAGGYTLSDSGGDITDFSRGNYDYWIVKTDAGGNKIWDKRFGGNFYDYCTAIIQINNGNYVLGGYSSSSISGDKTEPSKGGSDFWLVKIDENGNKIWDKTYGGKSFEEAHSLIKTSDNGFAIAGNSYSGIGGDKTEARRGDLDFWMVKLDNNGDKEWDKSFGGTNTDDLYSLRQTLDGGYLLGGVSSSEISGDKTENSRGNLDYWVVKMGCPPSSKAGALYGNDLCATGSVLLTADFSPGVKYIWIKDGERLANGQGRNYTATQPGTYRVIVYTDRNCGQISDPIYVINSCGKITNSDHIFPNPSQGKFTLQYTSYKAVVLHTYVADKNGKNVYAQKFTVNKGINMLSFQLPNLANGVYTLHYTDGTLIKQQKIIIRK